MGRKTDLKDSCAYCRVINCIDLFRHTKDDDELVGGELYVYKQMNHPKINSEDLSRYVCSNGALLQCACFIIGTLYPKIPEHYLINVSNEIVRDMKASFYLAMSGHYRQAIIIQRCVFENFLYGLYFYTEDYIFSKTEEEQNDVHSKFMSWLAGGFRKPDTYLREIIQRGGFISKIENKEWGKLYNDLSHFVHTIGKTPTGKVIRYGNVEIIGCYSEVMFDRESLIEWSHYFQRIFFLVLCALLTIYPFVKKEEGGQLALRMLRAEFRKSREELNDTYLNKILKFRIPKTNNTNPPLS